MHFFNVIFLLNKIPYGGDLMIFKTKRIIKRNSFAISKEIKEIPVTNLELKEKDLKSSKPKPFS